MRNFVHHFFVKMELDCAGFDAEDAARQARLTTSLLYGDKVVHVQTLEEGLESTLAIDSPLVRGEG